MITTDGLLAIWPNTLKSINLSKNYFWSLDQVIDWPTSLRVLNLSGSELSVLDCSNFPESLEELNISFTLVTTLPNFPRRLKKFVAEATKLRLLPSRCPDSLETLTFSGTRTVVTGNSLPVYWGRSLKHLDLNSNGLRQFPRLLPATLEYLNLSSNLIQAIPPVEKFPKGLKSLHLGNNRIMTVPPWFSELPKMKFTIQNNHLTEIPNFSHCIISQPQFIGEKYFVAALKFQRAWRRGRIPPPVRTWRRMAILKEELLALAMCPARAGRFEDISPEWGYVYTGP